MDNKEIPRRAFEVDQTPEQIIAILREHGITALPIPADIDAKLTELAKLPDSLTTEQAQQFGDYLRAFSAAEHVERTSKGLTMNDWLHERATREAQTVVDSVASGRSDAEETGRPQACLLVEPDGYGFGSNWYLLVAYKGRIKRFWLGQDAKFCARVLGINDPDELAEKIMRPGERSLDLRDEDGGKRMGEYLVDFFSTRFGGDEEFFSQPEWGIGV